MKQNNLSILYTKCIKQPNGCWIWTAGKTSRGYGMMNYQNKKQYAHRLSYQYSKGPITNGLHVCHSCDNPSCINPDHLWLGTNYDNILDKMKKGRAKTARRLGSQNHYAKLDEQQVKEIKSLLGKISHSKLAKQYNVSKSTINAISAKRNWSHIL